MNNWDVERNVSEIEEGQFTMGSGESGGETRLQHGSPAGTNTKGQDEQNEVRQAAREDSPAKGAVREGGSETEKGPTGFEVEGDALSSHSVEGGRQSGEDRQRQRRRERRRRERGRNRSSGSASTDLDKTLHLERLVRLEESLITVQKEVSTKFDLISNMLLELSSQPSGKDAGGEMGEGSRSTRLGHDRLSRRGGDRGARKVGRKGHDRLDRPSSSPRRGHSGEREVERKVHDRPDRSASSSHRGDSRRPKEPSRGGHDRPNQLTPLSPKGGEPSCDETDIAVQPSASRSQRGGVDEAGRNGDREDSRSPSWERGRRGHRRRKKKGKRKSGKVHFEDSSSESSEGAIPISREKHLEAVRKVPSLANRKNPLKWLLAYKQYSKSRKWGDADYCHMLPLVWDDRKGGTTEEWFEGLSDRRKSTPLKLEKAFVRKFAQEDTENFVQEAMYSVQGEEDFCEDWFIRVNKQFKQMREWVPRDMPSEERFMRVIVTRFTDRAMLQSLNEAQALDEDTESSTDGEGPGRVVLSAGKIRRLAKKADRLRRRLEAQGSKRRKQRESSPGYSLVDEISVKSIDLLEEGDDELEQVYEYYAENQVSNLGGVLSVRSVAVALARLELPRARQTRRESDMNDFRNVVSRQHEADHENQICGFHACKLRGCNMGGRCAHAHEDRANVKCTFYASPLECPHGIFCRKRHQNDEYGVWFRDRGNPGSFRFAIWKDQKSRFRREPREAQTQE